MKTKRAAAAELIARLVCRGSTDGAIEVAEAEYAILLAGDAIDFPPGTTERHLMGRRVVIR